MSVLYIVWFVVYCLWLISTQTRFIWFVLQLYPTHICFSYVTILVKVRFFIIKSYEELIYFVLLKYILHQISRIELDFFLLSWIAQLRSVAKHFAIQVIFVVLMQSF